MTSKFTGNSLATSAALASIAGCFATETEAALFSVSRYCLSLDERSVVQMHNAVWNVINA